MPGKTDCVASPSRSDQFRNLNRTSFDLMVVGGGIIGAGVARDAALRGLHVAVFEKADFGGGTTAGSTRLIHGGLRYLEMLDFRLVRLDLRERETLLRIAPHLIKPLSFLIPFYGESLFYRLKLRTGMILYDILSFDRSLPGHRILSAAEVRTAEPDLAPEGLQGAAVYADAQVDSPERLCVENLLDARENGACVLNYAEVTGPICSGGAIAGVRVRDILGGCDAEVRGRIVINATGPWLDGVAARLSPGWQPQIRATKGIHIACPPMTQRAVVLFSPIDGRLFFVIPWLGYSWIGTTDTDFPDDPRTARATAEDVRYLLESAGRFFPSPDPNRIHFTNAGVRALVTEEGDESSVSRLHRIVDGRRTGSPGLISILGGKLTSYRAIAEEATDLACHTLGVRQRSATATIPLPGARAASRLPAGYGCVAPRSRKHLEELYGSRAAEVFILAEADPGLAAPLDDSNPDIAAQVVFSVRTEQCERVLDFLLRRTVLGFAPDQGRKAVPAVVHWMSRELGWSAEREKWELESYELWRNETQAFRENLAQRPGVESCR